MKDILTYETLRACSLIGDRNVHTCLHRLGSICQIAVILVENIWINMKQHLPASVWDTTYKLSGIWVLLLICPMHVSLQTLPQIWTTCILSYEILGFICPHLPSKMSKCLIVSVPCVVVDNILTLETSRCLLTEPAPLWLHLITVCPLTVASNTYSAAGMTECPDTRRWTSRRPLTTRNAQFCDGHCGMLELDPALLANPEMLE